MAHACTNAESCMRRTRSKRSAATPRKSPKTISGRKAATMISATCEADPVVSKTNHMSAMS